MMMVEPVASPVGLRAYRFVELLAAQRLLAAHLRRLSGASVDARVDCRQLRWADAPAGLSQEYDVHRVLAAFIRAAVQHANEAPRAGQVQALLDDVIDRLVEVNRSFSYDDVIDEVELAATDAEFPSGLARALASMVTPTAFPGVDHRLPSGMPSVAKVRAAERWVLEVIQRWRSSGAGVLRFSAVRAAWQPDDDAREPSAHAWRCALVFMQHLRALTGPDWAVAAPHHTRVIATWWAGQDAWDPFPDRNGNGTADERGSQQALYDAFGELARCDVPARQAPV